jgi:DNA polymerase V
MHTNTFNNASFSETTNDTGEVVALVVRLSERRGRSGFRYLMCGVMSKGPMPETIRQPTLWGELARGKRE